MIFASDHFKTFKNNSCVTVKKNSCVTVKYLHMWCVMGVTVIIHEFHSK